MASGSMDQGVPPTLAERFVLAFRLPYGPACILLGFGIFGILNTAASLYAMKHDLREAIQGAFAPQNVAQSALVAYAFYAPRYMGRKFAETRTSLWSLMGDEGKAAWNPFANHMGVRPQVVAWIAFLAGLLLAVNVRVLLGGTPAISFPAGAVSVLDLLVVVYDIVSLVVATLALSSVVWTYYTITRAIHRFSQARLQLRPVYEDRFLGLKPIGSLALTLASVYFGFIALLLLSVFSGGGATEIGDVLGVGGFLFALIALGVSLFFFPLTRLHRRMLGEKAKARSAVIPELRSVLEESLNPGHGHDISRLFRVDMLDRKVAEMAVWPYDIGILGRLSVIAASVTAILISRILALIFRI